MKNLLLLFLSLFITFSCQEYGDDGLPTYDGGSLLNPDGTKKLKRLTNDVVTTVEMGFDGMPDPIAIVTQTYTEADFNRDDYGFVSVTTTTTDMSGLDDMMGGEDLPTDPGSTLTTTSMYDGNLLRELRTEEVMADSTTTSRKVFSYNNGRISSITDFENNEQKSTATFTFNDDNVVVERTYEQDTFGTETYNFSIVDSLITSITIDNTFSDNTIEVTLSRDSVNLTQANITRGSENLTATYAYDNMHYYQHALGNSTTLEDRLISEVITLGQIPAYSTSEQEASLMNIEAGIKGLTNLATHNLISRSVNGTIVERNSYTYDDEEYPVTISSELDTESTIDLSVFLDDIADMMLANFIENGMDEELAQAQVDQFLSMLSDTNSTTDVTSSGTIEYY